MAVKLYFILAFILLASCSMPDRDNSFDPEGDNFCEECSNDSSSSDDNNSFLSSENSSSSEFTFGTLDYESQTYKTVVIGEQVWMAENLNYNAEGSKCYGEGVAGFSEEEVLDNCKKYGRLYDWATAMDIDKKFNTETWRGYDIMHKGICPAEWHLPTKEDWDKLIKFIDADDYTDAENDYGFSALSAGEGNAEGGYGSLGVNGYWWSATEFVTWDYGLQLVYFISFINRDINLNNETKYGSSSTLYSVRCIKNDYICNGEIYNPELVFCYENKTYPICNGEVYKPVEQKCENNIILDKCTNSSINTNYYNIQSQFCYGSNIYDKCGGETYNPTTQKCENNILLDSKCGDNLYNSETYFCYDNTVHEKCSGETYNPTTYVCVLNELFPKCGSNHYNPETQFCYGDEVHEKCGGETYNPSTHTCIVNEIFNKCGESYYNQDTQFCIDNTIYEKTEITFSTLEYEGQIYKTVTIIGNQTWMIENLNYNLNDNKCYNNDDSNCEIYGRLYNWETANEVCPIGWHLPNNTEWNSLDAVWTENGTEFSAYSTGRWWSATEHEKYTSEAYNWIVSSGSLVISDHSSKYYRKTDTYSVRCIKD